MKRVGISAGLAVNTSSRFDNYQMVRVADNYVQCIAKIGAMPFVMPMIENEAIIEEQVKNLDALILSGGEDVNPKYYNELALSKLGETYDARDKYDIALAKYALKHKIPVLGICRGAQILNIVLGGSLYQDHSYISNDVNEHNYMDNQSLPRHSVDIEKGSFLYKILGEKAMINSFHHQSVKELAPSLKLTAIGEDGVVEGFEGRSKDNLVLGIQWHPEMMANHGNKSMLKIFEEFIHYQNPLKLSKSKINTEKRA